MNLEESDLYKERLEKNTKNRRKVMLSIILCALLVVIFSAIIGILKYQDSITEKLFLDGAEIKSIPKNFYNKSDDGIIYLNIKELGSILNYRYTKGEYNKFDEDENSCYLQNDFEIVSMSVNSNKFEKYIDTINNEKPMLAEIEVSMKNENGYYETFSLVNPVKMINGEIYVSKEDAQEMLNVQIDWKDYRFRFYTLEYMIKNAQSAIAQLGYTEMSGYYENLRATLYGYVVVGNGLKDSDGNLYGVVSLETGKEIISIKYDDIKFVQNVKEFYVTVSNGTMGILNSEGGTVIAPSEYENITLLADLENEKQLYLVEKDGEYGVLNRAGKTIIHAENDEIGYDVKDFESEEIENPSLIFGKVIPVKKDGKYGLFNVEGEMILSILYDGLGCKTTSKTTSSGHEESVLTIPGTVGIEGIVINQEDSFGIFDVNAQRIILPLSCSKIYSITKSGETTYYMEHDGQETNLRTFLEENNLINIDENGEYIEPSEENDNDNEENDNKNETNETTDEENVVENTNATSSNTTNTTSNEI